MSREENVINYYILCNKLKDLIRTGWQVWNVKKERLESVAEHIYGVQMLAIAINSEYKCDVDISKVIMMLAIHELEEIYIGDLTQFQTTKEDKEIVGHQAVLKVLECLQDKEFLNNLILEFDAMRTKEARFAHFCDKLECDLQGKIYGESHLVDLNDQASNKIMNNSKVKSLLDRGLSFEEMWLLFSQETYDYDTPFKEVSDYALTHQISLKKHE